MPRSEKQLLVTSDDFGMCRAVNHGILTAMRSGIVRSSNLMAPCPWFLEACELAKEFQLPVGIHLVLTCEWDRLTWAPLSSAPSLRSPAGTFYPTHESLAERATQSDIENEFQAQIRRALAQGISPTHLDLHMLTSRSDSSHARRVQATARKLARELGIPFTYETRADGHSLVHFQEEIQMSPLSSEELWAALESCSAPGTYHLIGHAASKDAELSAMTSHHQGINPWASDYRVRDLAFFTDPMTQRRLAELGFRLISVSELELLDAK